jgi:SAM-dependent methyltransferase
MDVRTAACFALSRRLMRAPAERNANIDSYDSWREESLSSSWSWFKHHEVAGKDVLDFGCGSGQLSIFLCRKGGHVVGVDIDDAALERAADSGNQAGANVRFVRGCADRLPLPDQSCDVIVAFDCMEHVMRPANIMEEWHRVLRPGGRVLIEWYPYKGPWGPHMEALIPLPWAHFIFGQAAMFRTAEMIYDLPEFTPRHWDLDEQGKKKPNKWRQWSNFREQGYINELTLREFSHVARDLGFKIDRFEQHSFGGTAPRRMLGSLLMRLFGEYFVSFAVVELVR